jgi:transposase InsO family protein
MYKEEQVTKELEFYKGTKSIVHTARGCHYRWHGWIHRMKNAGLIWFMSQKRCSPDNSACEGIGVY